MHVYSRNANANEDLMPCRDRASMTRDREPFIMHRNDAEIQEGAWCFVLSIRCVLLLLNGIEIYWSADYLKCINWCFDFICKKGDRWFVLSIRCVLLLLNGPDIYWSADYLKCINGCLDLRYRKGARWLICWYVERYCCCIDCNTLTNWLFEIRRYNINRLAVPMCSFYLFHSPTGHYITKLI